MNMSNKNNLNSLHFSQTLKSKNKINSFKSTNLNDFRKTNCDISQMQSPKVNNKKFRNNSQPNLLSFSDKSIIETRGTSLPVQYQRRTDDEMNKMFKQNKTPSLFDFLKKNKSFVHTENKITNENNISVDNRNRNINDQNIHETNNRNNMDNILYVSNGNNKSQLNNESHRNSQIKNNQNNKNEIHKNNHHYKQLEHSSSTKKFQRFYPTQCYSYFDNRKPNQNDVYKPKGYEKFYDEIKTLKRAQSSKIIVGNQNIPFNQVAKYLKRKTYESDIFQLKNKNRNQEEKYIEQKKEIPCYSQSDIFNLKNDKLSELKSGEKSYFKKRLNNFTVSDESKSSWVESHNMPSLLNHPSVSYNLLYPEVKGISKTKEEIQRECDKICPGRQIANKQKGLCEYIDLCCFAAAKSTKVYLDAIKNTKGRSPFGKTNECCSEFNDIYGQYKNLCNKPFHKFGSV